MVMVGIDLIGGNAGDGGRSAYVTYGCGLLGCTW